METEFTKELKEFIDNNKNRKIYNEVVDRQIFENMLARKLQNKRTNVGSIKDIYKFCQYFLCACMLNMIDLKRQILDQVEQSINTCYRIDFAKIFSEVEFEDDVYREYKNLPVYCKDNKIFVVFNQQEYEIDSTDIENRDSVYYLLDNFTVDDECYLEIKYAKTSNFDFSKYCISWNIKASVTYNKQTDTWSIRTAVFYADFDLTGLSLVAKYYKNHTEPLISISHLDRNQIETIKLEDWNGLELEDHHVYLCRGSNFIKYVNAGFNGSKHFMSFNNLLHLLT